MKREIKFRAFGANTMGVVDSYGQDFCAVRWGKDDVACDVFTGDIGVMQFTGLKDKNGTEIYEGDILKDVFESGNLQVVVYDVDRFIVKGSGVRLSSYACPSFIEIIGNIYESQ